MFILLETLYAAFDLIARRRRIFKVETIGDCYVAVSGLPEPRRDHAVAMAKFATDILRKVHELTRKLEVSLGPDTGDLTIRVGLHSGPVTAGVLRGERSRFQLFGDSMNTAARMEHNGARDKIQISQETADLLIAAGKWYVSRSLCFSGPALVSLQELMLTNFKIAFTVIGYVRAMTRSTPRAKVCTNARSEQIEYCRS